MRHAVAAILLLTAFYGARAAAAEEPPKAPQTIALQAVALPVIADRRLLNYVFVSIRLTLSPEADGAAVRAKEAFFRDDLVRMGHRTPFTRPDDYSRIDDAKVKAEVARFATTLFGPRAVTQVDITKEVSQKRSGLPPAPRSRAPDIVP